MKIETLIVGFLIVWVALAAFGIYRVRKKYKATTFEIPTPEVEADRLKKVQPFIKTMRRTGWAFLIVGSVMAIAEIPGFFGADGVVTVNGEPRRDLWIKIATSAFLLLFPLVGGIMALAPKKRVERCLLAFLVFSERFAASARK